MKPSLKVNHYETASLVNGPGTRFVLWLQGCVKACPGCFNSHTWDSQGGYWIRLAELQQLILSSCCEGITVSGGEPFLQAENLKILLEWCSLVNLSTMVYSGFQWAELKENCLPGARELLQFTDLLVDGPYLCDIPPVEEWTGSGNQNVIALSKTGVKLKQTRKQAEPFIEFVIHDDGSVYQTGWPGSEH